jgi:ATP-dependent DNA helicase RecQ
MEHLPLFILRKYFGYASFRGKQEQIIQSVLQRKDVFALMPTGGGKSLCFQIPALILPGTCLVISPLIALMKDQVAALRENGIEAGFLNSSLDPEEEQKLFKECLDGKIKLLYVSPERALLLSLRFTEQLNVNLIAVDEAHCVSQWGHDFRPEYTRLKNLREKFPHAPMIALTATADKSSRMDILHNLGLKDPEVFVSSFDRPNLSIRVMPGLNKQARNKYLLDFIQTHRNEAGIVYAMSRKLTEEISTMLTAAGITNAFYHAGMDARERSRVQDAFLEDEIEVIVATIAFGMGIDKSNVRWVVHYNLPKNMESYYQEIGRAGRDGLSGDTLLMYSIQDLTLLGYFARNSAQPEMHLDKLQRMQQFADARVCRRKILLSYFGEFYDQNCGNCDVCRQKLPLSDETTLALTVFRILKQIPYGISSGLLIQILRGNNTHAVRSSGFHLLSDFGTGKKKTAEEWNGMLLQLIALGFLEMRYHERHTLALTPPAMEVLEGKRKVEMTSLEMSEELVSAPVQETWEDPVLTMQQQLFERLREWRKAQAKLEKVPPYVIFHDKTLREITEKNPVVISDLLQINGISDRKLDKYGKALLKLISAG